LKLKYDEALSNDASNFNLRRYIMESVCRDTKALLVKDGRQDLAHLVDSYRAGYTPAERRTLERRLQAG
jgi:ATP-dependent helicase YprA (DUF1998 family)